MSWQDNDLYDNRTKIGTLSHSTDAAEELFSFVRFLPDGYVELEFINADSVGDARREAEMLLKGETE